MRKALFIVFLLVCSRVEAADRFISYFGDGGAGSLRLAIQGSCEDAGVDTIYFLRPWDPVDIHIQLESPLKIPAGCNGKITIIGSSEVETILDGSAISPSVAFQEKAAIDEVPGLLQVMTSGNVIRGLTFIGFKDGAGVTLMGNDNLVEDNFFGIYRKGNLPKTDTLQPNRFGVVISGNGQTLK